MTHCLQIDRISVAGGCLLMMNTIQTVCTHEKENTLGEFCDALCTCYSGHKTILCVKERKMDYPQETMSVSQLIALIQDLNNQTVSST